MLKDSDQSRGEARITRRLKWLTAGLVVAGLGALFIWAFLAGRAEQAAEGDRERPITAPQRVSRGPGGEIVVTLDRATQTRIGLQVLTLIPSARALELVTPGTLQEDPSRAFTLRAPIAGTLRAPPTGGWPRLGAFLNDRAIIGGIEPRLAPSTKVDLESRLAAAQSEVVAATAAVAAARAAFERASDLNAHGKVVADRAVEEADARLKGEEARLTAANQQVRLTAEALKAAVGPTAPMLLRLTQGGEVLEIRAQPGEAIESGQPILRVARFDTLVAKVEVPAGERVAPHVETARIVVIGHEDHPLRGELMALAASDPNTHGQTLLFRMSAEGVPLRPGQAVIAYLPTSGMPHGGVVIPRPAIVRVAGRAWAYVEIGTAQFTRREVQLDHPTEAGWFVGSGFTSRERVVVTGAGALLSEELKSEIRISD